MKVLLLCESYGGGVRTYIDSINANHNMFEENIEFLTAVSSKRLEKGRNVPTNYEVIDELSFGKSPVKLLKAIKKIHSLVKKYNVDVIHANSSYAGILVLLYAKLNKNIKYIYTPHGYFSFKNDLNSIFRHIVMKVEKMINVNAAKIIHVSNSEEKVAIENGICSKDNSSVIFNGIKRGRSINKKNINKNIFRIVNLARVDKQKNPYFFVEIADRVLKKTKHNIEFVWAGDGKYLRDINLKLNNPKIKFIGFVEQKEEFLSKADLYLSTSLYEGLPFSVIEAMAYGIPLLLSNVVGHIDLIENNINGYLYDFNLQDDLVNLICNLIENPTVINQLSMGSYEVFENNFSQDIMISKLNELYKSIEIVNS